MEKEVSKVTFSPRKAIANILFGIAILGILLLIFSLLYAKISGGPPTILGHQMYIVLSGSMNPAFDTGSIVFVREIEPAKIKDGDIITYMGLEESEQIVSHRVVSVNKTDDRINFTTKGDANEVNDPNPTPADKLIGKVIFAIPYLGYIMYFSQTKWGIVIMIIIPCSILLIYVLVKHNCNTYV